MIVKDLHPDNNNTDDLPFHIARTTTVPVHPSSHASQAFHRNHLSHPANLTELHVTST